MQPLRASSGQFRTSVRSEGLFGWRVEKLKAIEMEQSQLGMFYSGDAYLILNNHSHGAHLHMWMGEKCSADEQCACAMLATQLDHFLGGQPVHYREIQGHESPEFIKLFPKGISYKEGGVESGFRNVRTDSGPVRRLYQVKGKKNIRVKEVQLNWSSFSTGDCFILDLGQTIVSWSGSKANLFEKQKVREISALIRDSERNGKAEIQHLSEGEETPEMIKVLGSVPVFKDDSTEDDNEVDRSNSAYLYKVSDSSGSMDLKLLCDKAPFDQRLLDRADCFILDNGSNSKIFMWRGSGANEEERGAALKVAEQFIQRMNYSQTTQVEIVPQGRESVLFKQFFKSWS
ncbi:macrophage-capping protein-like [Hoplias malabaricus]|uniref:macrophage-capping protein-like n=1 Tax=Hoplias malabaricus TaxID=27720 RepID=UPI00346245F8